MPIIIMTIIIIIIMTIIIMTIIIIINNLFNIHLMFKNTTDLQPNTL